MLKKILAVALAGFFTLPFVTTGHAEAASQPQAGNTQIVVSSPFDSWKLNSNQISELTGMMKQFGVPSNFSPAQGQPGSACPGNQTAQPAGTGAAGKTVQPAKPAQSQKPAAKKTTQPSSQNTSNSQMNAFEKKVVDLTNQERAKAGLKPLKANNSVLSKMARDKSADMRDKNYFDHQSPTYGSPFDMMKKYGISFSTAGENIAAGQKTPEEVVNGWMNSPGHRANILNANFTTIGVGYVQGGSYGSYWTQEFIG